MNTNILEGAIYMHPNRYAFLREGIEEPEPIFRDDRGETRLYATCDAFGRVAWYPSVTSVISETSLTSPGLIEWIAKHGRVEANRLRDEAADYGTRLHTVIADYMQGLAWDIASLDERIARDLMAWDAFARERNVTPLAIEVQLVSHYLRVAGTADLVCEMDWNGKRVLAVIDVKSGRNAYRNHAVQVRMYAQMWNDQYSDDYPVTEWFNWSPKDWTASPTYTLKRQTEEIDDAECLTRTKLWHAMNKARPKTKTQYTGVLALGASKYIADVVDPDDEVRAKWQRLTGRTIEMQQQMGDVE